MSELPSGMVTFLFTDIERSTETLAAMGNEAFADALDTHRQLLRAAFKSHDGREIGTEGDSFFVAFARAHDAVQAAIDGQRALDGHSLRVRMGMHTGEALVRNTEYVGHDVHKAKRVSDAGHGGQILLSQTTADLVRAIVAVRDLGPHRLKDLGEPQRLYQVDTDEFPPLRSLESFATNLPLYRSTFIGRAQEIATVRKLLDEHRLVTLTGIGGCGKTRLAIQVGAEVLDDYPDGVFLIELGPLTDPAEVSRAVAEAVRFPMLGGPGPAGPTSELLQSYLTQRRCLLILDNCEHLIDAAAQMVDAIQQRCPDITVLATSREVLGVEGEQIYGVPSLPVPDADEVESDAVSLFVANAHATRTAFEVTAENASTIAEICRRLDGIPLAIEFASARIAHLSPAQIAEKLDDRFRLLTGGRRRVQRQQTLQAALDWSFDLLDDREKVVLRRLAVFPADFGLDVAEHVCSDGAIRPDEITDVLGSLVAKSLVQAQETADEIRFRLLETVRAYAAERLTHAGEADEFRNRHRDWFLAWAEQNEWYTMPLGGPIKALLRESSNITAAIEWCESQGRIDLLARIYTRAAAIWSLMGQDEQVQRWNTAIREGQDVAPDVRAAAIFMAASQAQVQFDTVGATELIHEAIEAARAADWVLLACALAFRAWLNTVRVLWLPEPERTHGIDDCRRDMDEAMRVIEGAPAEIVAYIAGMAGQMEMMIGDIPAAVDRLEQALAPYGGGTGPLGSQSAVHLGICRYALGDRDAAFSLMQKVADDDDWEVFYTGFTGPVATVLATGDIARAAQLIRSGFHEISRIGIPACFEDFMVGAAGVLQAAGDIRRAALVLSWVRSRTFDRGVAAGRSPAGYLAYRHLVQIVRADLEAEEAHRLRAEGTALTQDEAVAEVFEGLDLIDA